jgi:ABC-type phosphate transport system auxiliary subunit
MSIFRVVIQVSPALIKMEKMEICSILRKEVINLKKSREVVWELWESLRKQYTQEKEELERKLEVCEKELRHIKAEMDRLS